ncbi:hypothetical protein ALC62_12334 [Cyphomyrmex costatus]|uniref:Uncharacterized protein n=1 Tax=Cyphomyrmex costatus TaxID=456900 RepID=A0A151IBD8_9HYME|nr:hypothetical protein ALC62_12334 [Cyphomyrmex costatus]
MSLRRETRVPGEERSKTATIRHLATSQSGARALPCFRPETSTSDCKLHPRVRRTCRLLSSHSNALGELKVETTMSLCICIYCSPHAFAFSYGSLLYTKKLPECNGKTHATVVSVCAIDDSTIDTWTWWPISSRRTYAEGRKPESRNSADFQGHDSASDPKDDPDVAPVGYARDYASYKVDYHHQHFLNDKLPRVVTFKNASRVVVEIREIICGIDCTKRYLSAKLGQLEEVDVSVRSVPSITATVRLELCSEDIMPLRKQLSDVSHIVLLAQSIDAEMRRKKIEV